MAPLALVPHPHQGVAVALELCGTIVVGIIAVQSILTDQRVLLDVAIGLALVSFLGTVAFARYVGKGGIR